MGLVFIALWTAYYPPFLSTNDEYRYIVQAKAFSEGGVEATMLNLSTWAEEQYVPMTSPPGTSLLLTPFLSFPDWRTIFIMPLLCQLLTVVFIAWILRREGLNPLFGLLFLTYPVAVAFGRMVMSDMPNVAILMASLTLFWIASAGESPPRTRVLFCSGVLAGLSLLFRHTNVLVLSPFFLSYVLRRRPGSMHLIIGGLLGCLPRFLFYWSVWGHPIFMESTPQGFGLDRFFEHILFYGLSLNFVFPGLPVIAFFYRGRYRLELFIACMLYFLVYCLFQGGAHATGFNKRLILANRYMLPIVPLLILAAADPISRWAYRFKRKTVMILVGVILILIIPYWCLLLDKHHQWLSRRAEVRKIIDENTLPGSVLLHNSENVRKYLVPYGQTFDHQYAWWQVEGNDIRNALEHALPVFTVFIYREDRGWFNDCVKEYVSNLETVCDLEPVKSVTIGDETLNICRITRCWAPLKPHEREECYSQTPPKDWNPD